MALNSTNDIDPIVTDLNQCMATKVAVSNVVSIANNDTSPHDVDTNNHTREYIVLVNESHANAQQVPLFDVNRSIIDDKFEWALLVKDGWKKDTQWLEQRCSDFKNWRAQSDFQFGFIPLADSILNDTKHIGPRQ